jgi:outer membrane protein
MKQLQVLQLFLLISATAAAQAPTAASPQTADRIVTVNFNAAVLQTAEEQRALSALQTKLAPRQGALKTLNDEIEALRKQIEAAGDQQSDPEQATRARTLDSKERKLQRDAEDFKSDSQNESQQAFQQVAQKVYVFLQTYSQQHGYSAVIERGSDAVPIVWYVAADLDITEDLIKAYNGQAGVSSLPNDPSHRSLPASPTPRPGGPSPRP